MAYDDTTKCSITKGAITKILELIKSYVKEKMPTKTSQLTNDSGYIDTVYANNIQWGGNSTTGDASPFGMVLVDELKANRFAFINPDAVAIEYSTDSGVTWSDYGASNEIKQSLFTTTSNDIYLGATSFDAGASQGKQTRITLTLTTKEITYLFGKLRKILILFEGKIHSCEMKLETRTGENYKNNTDEWATVGTYKMGVENQYWTDIPLDLDVGTSYSSTSIWQIRFTFYFIKVNINYPRYAPCIHAIFGYGAPCYSAASTLGKTGSIYSYDMNQNVTFPAEVAATNFKGKINGYTVEKSVPSDAKFTDTTYDLTPYAKTADVDTKLSTKADKNVTKMLTVPNDGWTHNSQGIYTININIPGYGLTVTDAAIIDIDISETIDFTPESVKICQDEWAKIIQAATDDGYITLYATSPPTIPLTIQVRKL